MRNDQGQELNEAVRGFLSYPDLTLSRLSPLKAEPCGELGRTLAGDAHGLWGRRGQNGIQEVKLNLGCMLILHISKVRIARFYCIIDLLSVEQFSSACVVSHW